MANICLDGCLLLLYQPALYLVSLHTNLALIFDITFPMWSRDKLENPYLWHINMAVLYTSQFTFQLKLRDQYNQSFE